MDTFWCWFFIALCGAAIGGGLWFDRWLSRSNTPLEYRCNYSNCIAGCGLVSAHSCILGGDPWAAKCKQFEPTVGE